MRLNDQRPRARVQREVAQITPSKTRGYRFNYGKCTPSNTWDYNQGG